MAIVKKNNFVLFIIIALLLKYLRECINPHICHILTTKLKLSKREWIITEQLRHSYKI